MKQPVTILLFVFSALTACTDPAVPTNNNQNSQNNGETCTRGERRCLDTQTLVTCVDGSQETTVNCLDDEVCRIDDCVERTIDCDDACERPATRCTVEGNVETCNDHDNDGCDEFGDPIACEDGFFCDPEDGLCKPSECSDECMEGQTSCEDDLITTCFQSPRGCLEFGAGKECPDGDVCRDGACVPPANCTDECLLGEGVCTAQGQLRDCTTAANGCEVLAAAVDCPANMECSNGACAPIRNCVDQCLAGERVCVANDLAVCELQANGCLEFTAPTMCPGGQTCANQNGVVMCTNVAVSGSVVINEVFYDAVGPDVRGSGLSAESPTFVELLGPPGLDIAGYTIELVNGSDGATYGSFSLPNGAKLDGNGFAVIATDQPDTLLGVVLPFFTNVYYIMMSSQAGQDPIQNGADNVVLRDDSNAIEDAVAYGTSANFNYVGEGSCTSPQACDSAPDAISGRSIGRTAGADTDNNSADFVTFYPTPGFENLDLVINEVYFNEPGTDTGAETFVELMAPITGWEDMPLDGYNLRAINGFNGDDYIFSGVLPGIDFSGTDLHDGASDDGYVVICNIDTANDTLLTLCSVPYVGVDFQNGPDNFQLMFDGRVVDAVGYGTFSGNATFVGEGQAKPFASASAGKSIARWPITDPSRNLDTNDNRVDFHVVDPTPGVVNPLPQ